MYNEDCCKKENGKMIRESIYTIHIHEDDYFIVIAKNKADAIKKLQDYWRPICGGMDKLYCSVSRGQPLKHLKEGRHFDWFKRITEDAEKMREKNRLR